MHGYVDSSIWIAYIEGSSIYRNVIETHFELLERQG